MQSFKSDAEACGPEIYAKILPCLVEVCNSVVRPQSSSAVQMLAVDVLKDSVQKTPLSLTVLQLFSKLFKIFDVSLPSISSPKSLQHLLDVDEIILVIDANDARSATSQARALPSVTL